jgi:CubicO group peptidase (beta-lactamase class C family)
VGLLLCAALLLGACRDDDPSPRPSAEPATSAPTAVVTPSELPTAAPAELGFDARVLDQLAASAQQDRSTCFLVARHGTVVLEKYWDGGQADVGQEVFSVTKSVTSTLVGLAQDDGDLSLDDPAADYIESWRGTPSAPVTVRNLLANDSGRFWSPDSDYSSLVAARDRTAYAVGLAQQSEPGTVWAYNNSAIQTLDAVLRNATGTDPASFAAERLFGPLGMSHTGMTADGSGHSTNVFFGMQSTCRDLARFGTLFAQQGEWDGEQLVPRAWVEAATGGSSQELDAAYGLLWWLNRKGPVRLPIDADNPGLPPGVDGADQLAPGAPEDLFAALGFGGQVVLVDPTSDTVVVRLGGPGDAASRGYSFRDATRVVTEALTDSPPS